VVPIHELLNRLRWDPAFARGGFVLGYYDRVADRVIRVPASRITLMPGEHFSFQLSDADGHTRDIPFHRVREVYKDGALIWHRKP